MRTLGMMEQPLYSLRPSESNPSRVLEDEAEAPWPAFSLLFWDNDGRPVCESSEMSLWSSVVGDVPAMVDVEAVKAVSGVGLR